MDNEFSFIRETETNKFSMPWANKELTEEKSFPENLIKNFIEGIE